MPSKTTTKAKTTRKSAGLLERLAAGPVICAEGYLFEFERRGYLQAGAFVPEVVLEHPDLVESLHRDFVHAGSDVVEAFTYYAHRAKLKIIGREKDLEKINRAALRIAANVARSTGTLLAGDICNTSIYGPDDAASHRRARASRTAGRSPPRWIPSSATATRSPGSARRPSSSACGISGCAAAPGRITSGVSPRRWAGARRPVASRPTCPSTSCSAPTSGCVRTTWSTAAATTAPRAPRPARPERDGALLRQAPRLPPAHAARRLVPRLRAERVLARRGRAQGAGCLCDPGAGRSPDAPDGPRPAAAGPLRGISRQGGGGRPRLFGAVQAPGEGRHRQAPRQHGAPGRARVRVHRAALDAARHRRRDA